MMNIRMSFVYRGTETCIYYLSKYASYHGLRDARLNGCLPFFIKHLKIKPLRKSEAVCMFGPFCLWYVICSGI